MVYSNANCYYGCYWLYWYCRRQPQAQANRRRRSEPEAALCARASASSATATASSLRLVARRKTDSQSELAALHLSRVSCAL